MYRFGFYRQSYPSLLRSLFFFNSSIPTNNFLSESFPDGIVRVACITTDSTYHLPVFLRKGLNFKTACSSESKDNAMSIVDLLS